MQAHEAVAHFSFDLRPWYQGGHRVDDDHVHGVGTHQGLGDFEALLPGVRLADKQIIEAHAQFAGIARIHRVFRIHKCADAALALGRGGHVQGQGGLSGTLRSVDFHHAPLRQSLASQGQVQADRAGLDAFDLGDQATRRP